MKKFTLPLRILLLIIFPLFLMAFVLSDVIEEDTAYIQQVINDHYDLNQEQVPIKRYELSLTNTGFCRYKKYLKSGKVEYFSFNLKRFKDMDYLGNDKKGRLLLHTKGEDVIVQTYNDRKGDIDSMATSVSIPLRDVEPEMLIGLSDRLIKMNGLLLIEK